MKLEEGVEEITIEDNKYQLLYGGYSEIIIPNSIKKIKVNDFKSINSFVFENYKEQCICVLYQIDECDTSW